MNIINQAYSLLSECVQPQGRKLLTLTGFLFVSLKSLDLLRSFYRTFLVIGHNLSKRYGPGSWALVTGAAGGIGSAFAQELAAKGFNLILIDLNEQRLQEVAVMVKAKYPNIMTKTITCNFGHSWNEGFYDGLMEELQGIDISLLVNNVGTLNSPGQFYNVPEESILNTLTVNVLPMTILTRRLIPLMMKRPERSGIINISSVTGVTPSSISVVYSATKAYVDFFSRAIEKDIKDKIDIISIRPDAVSTGMLGSPKVGLYVIRGEDVARASLRKLGNVSYAFGDWRHEIKTQLAREPTLRKFFLWHFRTRVMRRT